MTLQSKPKISNWFTISATTLHPSAQILSRRLTYGATKSAPAFAEISAWAGVKMAVISTPIPFDLIIGVALRPASPIGTLI